MHCNSGKQFFKSAISPGFEGIFPADKCMVDKKITPGQSGIERVALRKT